MVLAHDDEPHVVIFGCPRGGTSIMGEMFEHVAGFDYYFEPGMDWLSHAAGRWAVKNPVDLGGGDWRTASARRTPGLPCNLVELREAFPARYIWIVRHPLDNALSLVPGLTQSWNHPPEPPNWRALMTEPVITRGLWLWRWFHGVGYRNLRVAGISPLLVRYEDLVHDPRAVVDRTLAFVQASELPSMQWYVNSVADDTSGYQAKCQERWVTHDHSRRVERWRTQMLPEDVARVWPVVADLAEAFGYRAPA